MHRGCGKSNKKSGVIWRWPARSWGKAALMHNKTRLILSARSRSIVIGIILAALAVSAQGATLTVTSTADSGGSCPGADCTLRQAIAAAHPGDTINFSLPASSMIELTNGELVVNKDLTIEGPGPQQLFVERKDDSSVPRFRIFNVSGNVTISGLTIANGYSGGDGTGVAIGEGGGIYYNSLNTTLTIARCAITANFAGADGGGIALGGGALTLTDSVIFGNEATTFGGGGIFVYEQSTATITNTTISQNRASLGGGILNSRTGTVTLTNSTIAQNQATSTSQSNSGGGFFLNTGTGGNGTTPPVTVENTIIADNTPDDFAGPLNSRGYNLIGNTQGTQITGTTTGNQLNVNPMLGPLQNNGGPTFTHALLSGSPAIDAGNSSGSITDQRGLARPVDSPTTLNASGGDGSDIGAYEVQPDQLPGCNTINTVVSNTNDSGAGSLRDVIANVCNGSTITFASNVRGAINLTSGELAFNKSLAINGPGANLLSVQRSSAAGIAAAFRVFNIGSGVFNPGYTANASISGLTIANGIVPGGFDFGGGIFSNATLTLSGVTLSGNSAGFGGGIANIGTLNLTNSTISNNSADTGGGIHGSILNCVNSTISGNTARTDNAGGINVGTVSLINTTVVHNSAAGTGGGLNIFSGNSVRARNSIIALNTAASGPDVSGPLTSDNFNLVGNASGGTITPSQFADQLGSAVGPIDPLLGPLKDNGGPTFTHALLSGSPAIDKGHSSGFATDQRGFTRPSNFLDITNAQGGDGGDIGAFEVPAPASVTTLANISTRLRVETGDNVLIGGFIVTGASATQEGHYSRDRNVVAAGRQAG